MININDYVFFDTETTGLSITEHCILELSYAIGDGEIKTVYNSLATGDDLFSTADPDAIRVNKYFERFAGEGYGRWYWVGRQFQGFPGVEIQNELAAVYLALPASEDNEWDEFFAIVAGKTLVGANPGFDRAFLEVFNRTSLKANHRLFDIQAFAAGIFFYAYDEKPWMKTSALDFPSFAQLCDFFSVINPDQHTSAGDVWATREVWKRLVGIA